MEDFCPSSVIPNYKNAPQSENLVLGGPEKQRYYDRETASCLASNRAHSEVSIRTVLPLAEGYLNGRLAVPIEAHNTEDHIHKDVITTDDF